MRVLNIRGTSGSGKSTLVRAIMDRYQKQHPSFISHTIHSGSLKTLGRVWIESRTASEGLMVLGRYETACGGCDTIKTQDEVTDLVRRYSKTSGLVVFEGLLVSQIYGRYRDLAKEIGPDYKWLTLDTPLNECIRRVSQRRVEAGKSPEFNTKNTEQKWWDNQRNFKKAEADGLNPIWLNYQNPLEHLHVLGFLW